VRVNRERRSLSGALCALALVVSVSGCGLFASRPGPADVTNDYVSRLARGDTQGAAALTDDAGQAKDLLDKVRTALTPAGLQTKVEQVRDVAGDATSADATVTLKWDLGNNRSWEYQTKLDLRRDGDDWKVHWAPSAVHPELAAQQTIALTEVKPQLAPVLDRDGTPLLAPDEVVSVVLDPKQAGDVGAVAAALGTALSPLDKSITQQAIIDGVGKTPAGQLYQVAALRDADYQSVKPQIYELPGVRFSSQESLLAPSRNFAAQVLPAIRKQVEQQIAGKSGYRISTVNAAGAEVEELGSKQPEPAQAVTASLSRTLQTAAEDAVEPMTQPTMIVAIQPSTGDVLAVAQNEAADAQGPIALSGRFPPGSTFKIISAAAALESGKATADTAVPCPGKTTIDGRRVVPNSNEFDKGTIPLHSAFAFSCNTTFAQLAVDMPPDLLTSTAKKLGLGVDFEVPAVTTVTGSVPPADDVVERAEDAFGQGKVVASPFGMALVAATVAKGTMPTPGLLKGHETKVDAKPDAVPATVLDPVRQMMREVVTSGTATQLADISDLRGKTGTAQFGDGVNSHGWFVGYRGDVAFATLVLGANSSVPAIDVSGKFLRAAG
jgi:cell division protein FtsI/penicillin-binding protein 2